MDIRNLQSEWGSAIRFENPLDFFKQTPDYWKKLIYNRKLLVFKKMNFSIGEYAELCSYFGNMWSADDYQYSQEQVELVEHNGNEYALSTFNNVLSPRMNTQPMHWHADIPNKKINPFPFRSLWITENPNPTISGITGFLNISYPEYRLSKELRDMISRMEIIQQSWYMFNETTYVPGQEKQTFPFVKTHPITGEKSLRLNFFNEPGKIEDAWICGVKLDGKLLDDCLVLKRYLDELLSMRDRMYFHTWDTHDIIVYDNWSFVHNRSKLVLNPGERRHFYRANIDHDLGFKI